MAPAITVSDDRLAEINANDPFWREAGLGVRQALVNDNVVAPGDFDRANFDKVLNVCFPRH